MPSVSNATTTIALLLTLLLGGCSIFSSDPRFRTPGVMFSDERLEGRLTRDIRRADPGFKSAHLVVVSYNGMVLLAGQVGTAALKAKAGTLASSHPKVRSLQNELAVGGPISYPARTNDSWLTAKVKSKLLASKRTAARKVKVVTENGVVYLLGIATRSEAEAIVAVARTVYGVQRIVKVFEYIEAGEPAIAAAAT